MTMTTSNNESGSTPADTDYEADFGGKYSTLLFVKGGPGCEKQHFGQKGFCRYCGETDPKQFRKIAHLIPEALGNEWLFSNDECDVCNGLFSDYESNLAAALRPILTIGGTEGKANKVPQTGRTGGQSVIKHTKENGKRSISIMTSAAGAGVSIDPSSGIITLDIPVAAIPFRPRFAYKALAKMAYALLPKEELAHFAKLRAWIRAKPDAAEFDCLETGLAFGSLGNAPNLLCAALLRRVEQSDNTPYMLFVLCAGSVCLMIDLMSDDRDDHFDRTKMGCVDIKWAIELGPKREVRIQYDKFRPMNWSATENAPQPVETFSLEFNPRTCVGRVTPVLRENWR